MKTRTTKCNAASDYFVQFVEDDKIVAEFGTTRGTAFRYNRLREQWRSGITLEKLKAAIAKITKG